MVDAQELFDKASSIESVNKEDAIERYIEIVNSVKGILGGNARLLSTKWVHQLKTL